MDRLDRYQPVDPFGYYIHSSRKNLNATFREVGCGYPLSKNRTFFHEYNELPMKKLLLFAGVLLLVNKCYGQKESDVTGTWKITTLQAGIYHNYKNDSTSVPKEMQESLRGNADSLFTVNLIKGMVMEFTNYLYVFGADGSYLEKKEKKIKRQGTYLVDTEKQIITLVVKDKFGGESRQQLQFRKQQQALEFKVPSDEKEIVFTLEKVR